MPARFDEQLADARQDEHLPPAPFDLERHRGLIDDKAQDRLLARQRRDDDLRTWRAHRDRSGAGERLDQRLLAGRFEIFPEVCELPFAVWIRQPPAVVNLVLVVAKAERATGQARVTQGVLDDHAAAFFELAEGGENLGRFTGPDAREEKHLVARQFARQHVLGRHQHARPPHSGEIVQDDARLIRPAAEVNGDVGQRVMRREPRAVSLKNPQQILAGAGHRKAVQPPPRRAEGRGELLAAGVVREELALQLLPQRVVHREECGRPEVAPRRQAVIGVINRVAVRECRVGRRDIRLRIAQPEGGDGVVGGEVGKHLPHVGQILAKRVRQDRTAGAQGGPRFLAFALLLGEAPVREFRQVRGDAARDPFVGRGVALLLVAVQLRRLLPIPADGRVPTQRDPAEARNVRLGLGEQRQPPTQLGEILRQGVFRIPFLVMQHRGHGRHRPHAEPGERHELQILCAGPGEFFERRAARSRGIRSEKRIDRGVAVRQKRLQSRTARHAPVVTRHGRAAVGFRVAINVREKLEVGNRLALADAQANRIARDIIGSDRRRVFAGRQGGRVEQHGARREFARAVVCRASISAGRNRDSADDGLELPAAQHDGPVARGRAGGSFCRPQQRHLVTSPHHAAIVIGVERHRLSRRLCGNPHQTERPAGPGRIARRNGQFPQASSPRQLACEHALALRLEHELAAGFSRGFGFQSHGQSCWNGRCGLGERRDAARPFATGRGRERRRRHAPRSRF